MGFRSITELDDDLRWLQTPIPADLWNELRHERLIREDAPVPNGDAEVVER
jgi:D-threo-aldose 1-dehydrogenase